MDTKQNPPLLVGIAEAARLLGVSTRTVQNLIFGKKLIARKIGRRTLLSYKSLVETARHDTSTGANGDE
jgi:excisionase family DNA binding protein